MMPSTGTTAVCSTATVKATRPSATMSSCGRGWDGERSRSAVDLFRMINYVGYRNGDGRGCRSWVVRAAAGEWDLRADFVSRLDGRCVPDQFRQWVPTARGVGTRCLVPILGTL